MLVLIVIIAYLCVSDGFLALHLEKTQPLMNWTWASNERRTFELLKGTVYALTPQTMYANMLGRVTQYLVEILGPLLMLVQIDPNNFDNFLGIIQFLGFNLIQFCSSVWCDPFRGMSGRVCSCYRLEVNKRRLITEMAATPQKATQNAVDAQVLLTCTSRHNTI